MINQRQSRFTPGSKSKALENELSSENIIIVKRKANIF
jgi:hypothetical protein